MNESDSRCEGQRAHATCRQERSASGVQRAHGRSIGRCKTRTRVSGRLSECALRYSVGTAFRTGALDREFDEELESHLVMLTEDNIRRGMTPEQARREALLRMGGPVSLRAQHRDVRGLPAVETVLQDVRFAFRLLAKDRLLSAAAIVALALGIGANSVGFTIVNAAFFRVLPFEDSDRLYTVSWQNRSGRRSNVS
jgi:hypothetical protein